MNAPEPHSPNQNRLGGFPPLYGPVVPFLIVLPSWPYYVDQEGWIVLPLWESMNVFFLPLLLLAVVLVMAVFRPDRMLPPVVIGSLGFLFTVWLFTRYGASETIELTPAGTASLLLAIGLTVLAIVHVRVLRKLAAKRPKSEQAAKARTSSDDTSLPDYY
ncbi:hypothetical protein [Stackebrandtia soli]|uniref:hypothetical protein n=1 Tax=Stackebrandtia soli TaxID=1892856 RepID=UPI0039EB5ADE